MTALKWKFGFAVNEIRPQGDGPPCNINPRNLERVRDPFPAIPATLNVAPGGINSAAAKEMENLSVEQLQKMVELEEKTKVIFYIN